MSRFAVVSDIERDSRGDSGLDDLPLDENQLLRAMNALESDMGKVEEDNPRALAQLMRKFGSTAGIEYGEQIEHMLHRLESGEDPDVIEAEMGDIGHDDDIINFLRAKKATSSKKRPPKTDTTLYEM